MPEGVVSDPWPLGWQPIALLLSYQGSSIVTKNYKDNFWSSVPWMFNSCRVLYEGWITGLSNVGWELNNNNIQTSKGETAHTTWKFEREWIRVYNTAEWIQQKVTAIVLFQPIVMNELLPTTCFFKNTSYMHSDLLHKATQN